MKNVTIFVKISHAYWYQFSVVEPEPVLFGRGRSRCEAPAPGSGPSLDTANRRNSE